MEGLLCLSKPAKEYAEFQACPSENNNADPDSEDVPHKSSLSGKLSTTSMTSVGSMSAVSNEELKDFLEQMKWHINNKLDNTRIEMVELRKKVNSIDEKLKIVLEQKEGSCEHCHQEVENGTLEPGEESGGADGDGGGVPSAGNSKGGIRRGSGSLAKSIKGVFMNSNNNKVDRHSHGNLKPDKQTNGGPIAEEEELEKRKTVTFGQDVVVKEFQRVFSGRKRSKKGQKVIVREEVPEEDEEEAEAERNNLENGKHSEILKENGHSKDEDSDDFTDSEEETQRSEAASSGSKGLTIDIAKLREEAWRNSKSVDAPNQYQNTTIGDLPEDTYEIPVQDEPPALPPTISRPPIKRIIDEREDFYEDPDDQESGRGSMPPGSCSDEGSGNTFVFSQKGDKTDHQIEEDFNSDSTEYEDVEDIDLEQPQQEKQKKPKVDKLEEFKNDHRNEEDIDLIDRLLMLNNYFSTIKSVGKWEKRYCIARDGQLFIYKSYKDKQSKAQRLPLMGYNVFLLGQQGKQDHVIRIEHHNIKPPILLASESAETSNKWVAVLQRYSTINHTIVPGGQQDEEDGEDSPDKKKGKLFHREKKDGTPQLTMEGDVLSGYVNIFGAKFGEAKIRRRWISLHDMVFSCSVAREEPKSFSFNIRGIDVTAADKKEVKMKGAFKLSKDGEVYLFIEALNMLDAGHLLKKLVSASMSATTKTSTGGRPASSNAAEESGMVAKLLASFETAADQTDNAQIKRGRRVQLQNQLNKKFTRSRQSTVEDQGLYEDTIAPPVGGAPDDIYDDVLAPPIPPPSEKTTAQKKTMSLPPEDDVPAVFEDLYLEVLNDSETTTKESPAEASVDSLQIPNTSQAPSSPSSAQSRIKNFKLNFKVKKDKEKEVISPTEPIPGEKKETEKERKQREKREKKEKKEKEKKEKEKKEKKKKKEKEEVEEVPSTPTTPSTPVSTPPVPSTLETPEKIEVKKPSPALQRKPSAPVNKFKDSSMSHLLLKDKLMQDRKELETQQKELKTKIADLRAKKMSSSDAIEKEKIQKDIDVMQKDLRELNKKHVKISAEIDDATGKRKDANENDASESSPFTKKASVRSSSPGRENVSKGTVSDRMKMFSQSN
ncbi:actin filament-associated protein 1-like 2 isoform X1 [Lytechinus variegatus]|uniref:actin filament-associated protein 1-like 2 isoform X1 n=1 Tax=Lytechinus variegatus TaxID=7654 RepID=UPI001BB15D41|nr:actin filament-associated protein 1-like 2 isoform X1 [Lytechinus variegatus]